MATNPGDIVMDPFGGGGSSFEAAQGLKRYWIGSEITDCLPIARRLTDKFPGSERVARPRSYCPSLDRVVCLCPRS